MSRTAPPDLVSLEAGIIREVQAAYLDARHRGALDHTAFEAAVFTLCRAAGLDARAARSVVARILPEARD